MSYRAIGSKILIEEIIDEDPSEQIVSTAEEPIIRGKAISIGNKTNVFTIVNNENGGGTTSDLSIDDTIWFVKRDAIQLPFNKNLYIIEDSDILVIENNEVE